MTGNGSIDANVLIGAWASLTPTSTQLGVTSGGTTEGSPLTLNATVSSTGTSKALTGRVSFYFDAVDKSGALDIGASLGDVAITATKTGGKWKAATAQLKTTAPAGLTGSSTIVAFYGGDADYLGLVVHQVEGHGRRRRSR